jgi:hypothetical protein
MSSNLKLKVPLEMLEEQDLFLNDEKLTAYADEFYYPTIVKKDRAQRLRNFN